MKEMIKAACLMSFLIVTSVGAEEPTAPSNAWLLDAESDERRFELLEGYLGGFSSSMHEVGERYKSVHDALMRDNLDLANYHWGKIRAAIRNGYMKRPARQANADAIFLDQLWGNVSASFQSGNVDQAWAGFESAKSGCMACHAAEKVPFMNNQSLFDLGRPE